MNTVKIASLIAMSILILLGVLGMVVTHRMVLSETEFGLLRWEEDSTFIILAYGIPVVLAFLGAMGAANVLSGFKLTGSQ